MLREKTYRAHVPLGYVEDSHVWDTMHGLGATHVILDASLCGMQSHPYAHPLSISLRVYISFHLYMSAPLSLFSVALSLCKAPRVYRRPECYLGNYYEPRVTSSPFCSRWLQHTNMSSLFSIAFESGGYMVSGGAMGLLHLFPTHMRNCRCSRRHVGLTHSMTAR